MSKSVTTDAEGGILTTTVSDASFTIQYSRKLGRENYGNEELGIFAQFPVADGTSFVDIEKQANEVGAFAKAYVLKGLGRTPEALDGVEGPAAIVDPVDAQAEAKPRFKKPATPSKAGATSDTSKSALWEQLLANPDSFWDNRATKKGRQPDFKHKDSGEALWIDSKDTPEAAKERFAA